MAKMALIDEKYSKLKQDLSNTGGVAIAFSSGVDSTFLLQTAVDVLGTSRVLAITASSYSFPKRELEEAKDFCQSRGINHIIVESEELAIEGFSQNPPNRCYLCKRELFTKIITIAQNHGISAVAEGSNMDDMGGSRTGLQAVAGVGVLSPLRKAGLYKDEIRQLSKQMGLPTAQKPSFACLSSRFPYGEEITAEKLKMVEVAEQLLLDMGFAQVRVRIHENKPSGYIARIEVNGSDLPRLVQEDARVKINSCFKKLGFAYVSADLCGYRTGSMNEALGREV